MRSILTAALIAWMTLINLPARAQGEPPLENGWYVSRDTCPGECCSFGTWTATEMTALYEEPRGRHKTRVLTKGEIFEALSGNVYSVPLAIDVVYTTSSVEAYFVPSDQASSPTHLKAGQRIYLLHYVGEGFRSAWIESRLAQIYVMDLVEFSGGPSSPIRSCQTPSAQCWWSVPEDSIQAESQWWVNLRLVNGSEGWTQDWKHFTGQCRY